MVKLIRDYDAPADEDMNNFWMNILSDELTPFLISYSWNILNFEADLMCNVKLVGHMVMSLKILELKIN